MARCANRRLREAARTCWNRLEPVTPGSQHLTKAGGGSLPAYPCAGLAGVGAGPRPSPSLVPCPGLETRQTKGSGAAGTPRRVTLVLPSLCSHFGCVETCVGSPRCHCPHSLRPRRGGRALRCLGPGFAGPCPEPNSLSFPCGESLGRLTESRTAGRKGCQKFLPSFQLQVKRPSECGQTRNDGGCETARKATPHGDRAACPAWLPRPLCPQSPPLAVWDALWRARNSALTAGLGFEEKSLGT